MVVKWFVIGSVLRVEEEVMIRAGFIYVEGQHKTIGVKLPRQKA